MMMEIRLTEDGSNTLYVPEIEECYHSTCGAVMESRHVFINSGLQHFISCNRNTAEENGLDTGGCESQRVRILEIGFGTGLNTFLTLLEAERLKIQVDYTTLELFPVSVDEALKLNYPEILFAERTLFEKIHRLPWEDRQVVTPYFKLHKAKVDFIGYELKAFYDVIYFDAFSPEKQPEMWTKNRFDMIYKYAGNNAALTTYCAKGAVRRAMQAAGFVVERLPGAPGKREMLRGRRK
jgi:tRNA U34 5-methylaminomethyl-2-thiouridine-forming methyltransferase MnmC